MWVKVRFYAELRELLGVNELNVKDLPEEFTLYNLLSELPQRCASIGSVKESDYDCIKQFLENECLYLINGRIDNANQKMKYGDLIDIMPFITEG